MLQLAASTLHLLLALAYLLRPHLAAATTTDSTISSRHKYITTVLENRTSSLVEHVTGCLAFTLEVLLRIHRCASFALSLKWLCFLSDEEAFRFCLDFRQVAYVSRTDINETPMS